MERRRFVGEEEFGVLGVVETHVHRARSSSYLRYILVLLSINTFMLPKTCGLFPVSPKYRLPINTINRTI